MAVRTNLCTNPSAETNATGYTAQGAGSTATRVTTQFRFGIASIQVSAAAVVNAGVTTPAGTIGASVAASASLYIKGNAGTEIVDIEFRNQAGTVIQSRTAVALTTGWQRFTFSGTTPGGTTSVHIRVNRPASSPAQTYFVDGVMYEATVDPGDYFDGDTVDTLVITYAWTGTANASTSTATDNASITVSGYNDAAPSPRVDVTIPVWGGTVYTNTVERIALGDRAPVRGALNELAPGGFLVTDYEVPIGVPVTYQATGYDLSGNPIAQTPESATVQLTAGQVHMAWIHDPLAPDPAMNVMMGQGTADELGYPMETDIKTPIGASIGVAISAKRRAASGVKFSVITLNSTDADTFRNMIIEAGVLVIRPNNDWRLPLLSYLAAPSATEQPKGTGVRVWVLEGDLVAPPAADIAVPVHTWQEVIDAYTDWQGLMNAKATWGDVIRDPT